VTLVNAFISWFATIWNASVSKIRYSPLTRLAAGAEIADAKKSETSTATTKAGTQFHPCPEVTPLAAIPVAPALSTGIVNSPAV